MDDLLPRKLMAGHAWRNRNKCGYIWARFIPQNTQLINLELQVLVSVSICGLGFSSCDKQQSNLNFSSINVFSQDVSLTRSASDRYWQGKWFLLNLSCKTCMPEGKGLRRVRLHPSPSTSQADVIHVDQRSTERSWWSAPLIIITAGHHDLLHSVNNKDFQLYL